MHPRLHEGVTLGYFTRRDDSQRHYFIMDKNKRRFEVSYTVYQELRRADGTHPLRISSNLLKQLKAHKLLTTSRFLFDGLINRFILFPIGRGAKRFRPLCRILNRILPFLTLALFAAAIVTMRGFPSFAFREISFAAYLFLLVFSLLAHEFAHLIAGISYGFCFSEMGLMLLGIFPFGAYVSYYDKKHVKSSARVQLSLAGIEANLLLGSLFLLLSMHPSRLDACFFTGSYMNFFLAALNLIPASGLDGGAAFGALLGFRNIGDFSMLFFKKRAFRRRVLQAGPCGYLCAASFCVNCLANAFFVLFLAFDLIFLVLSFSDV